MSIKVIDTAATCKNIGEIMEKRGVTPKQVQNALQLESVQAVYKWLSPNSKTMPSLDSLVQLADFLECSMEELIVLNEVTD